MPGIYPSIVCHHLTINPNIKLVAQRKQKLGEERRKVVDEEVKKLADARLISEINDTHISSPSYFRHLPLDLETHEC